MRTLSRLNNQNELYRSFLFIRLHEFNFVKMHATYLAKSIRKYTPPLDLDQGRLAR